MIYILTDKQILDVCCDSCAVGRDTGEDTRVGCIRFGMDYLNCPFLKRAIKLAEEFTKENRNSALYPSDKIISTQVEKEDKL